MSFLDSLPDRYRVVLCDIWGCIHDGRRLYPGAAARLQHWRSEGRRVVLVSNAPRPAATVEEGLARIGLPSDAWDDVVTGGDVAIDALKSCDGQVGFIGTDDDRADLESGGVAISEGEDFTDLACAGLDWDRGREQVEEYRGELRALAARDVLLHCLNPDRIAIHAGQAVACAGALADLYIELGGRVAWYGKPYPAIYERALIVAGSPPRDAVLAVGDSLVTDVLGAARAGIDLVFLTGGISRGESFPPNFSAENGLGDWRPVAEVGSLG